MKRLEFALVAVFVLPAFIKAEPASIYKYTCDNYPCTEEDLNAMNLVNNNYGKQLENRLINNTYYSHPWYFIYKKNACKYRVYAKEDRPTHTANMETFTVDICKKTIKAMWETDKYPEIK